MASCLVAAVVAPAQAGSQPVLRSGTEQLAKVEKPAPRAVGQAILDTQEPGVVADLRECMKDKDVAEGAWERVFVATPLPASKGKDHVYFVRPTDDPYCQTFYGAHVFQFWFVAERTTDGHASYHVDFAEAADQVDVLRTAHHGRNDFLIRNQTGVEAWDATMRFDGKKWLAVRCTRETFEPQTPRHEEPCQSR